MPFVKLVKNKAYYKRFQVKYRRRREGKTDYRARRAMVLQDKTKFNAPKFRLVVRITNKDVICQIVHAKAVGDDVLTAAYAHELPGFGIPVGLTNYAACYATGLLAARRCLSKLKIADKFPGTKEVTGQYVEPRLKGDDDSEDRYPFKAILDVGLARTTTGARVFGALKGAVDGGLAIPHDPKRFAGFDKEKDSLDAKAHRARIFGQHVADYMKEIKEEQDANPDEKITQFSRFAKNKLTADKLEEMYKKGHAAIRADPSKKASKKAAKPASYKPKSYASKKLSKKEKREASAKKVASLRAKLSS